MRPRKWDEIGGPGSFWGAVVGMTIAMAIVAAVVALVCWARGGCS